MQIRKITVLGLAILVLALAPFSFAQFGSRTPHRLLGYYDPATGAFQPLHSAADAEAPAVTPTTGTLTMKYTITVDAVIPTNGVVGCGGEVTVSDSAGVFFERGSAIAKLVSGKTYTCSVIIHYSWPLASPTTDKIEFSADSDLLYGYQVTATNGTQVVVEPVTQRDSSGSVAPISVPANGASTTVNISATL
jgi:hypothetical protein